jgi:NADP-dependent 3-hydroxy acid dehydrogenase YdfG
VLGARRKERIEALARELSANGGTATALVTDNEIVFRSTEREL